MLKSPITVKELLDAVVTDAPINGTPYVRKDGEWVEASGPEGMLLRLMLKDGFDYTFTHNLLYHEGRWLGFDTALTLDNALGHLDELSYNILGEFIHGDEKIRIKIRLHATKDVLNFDIDVPVEVSCNGIRDEFPMYATLVHKWVGRTLQATLALSEDFIELIGDPFESSLEIERVIWTGVTKVPPATPTGLSATTISSTQIDLNWKLSLDAESYDIYRDGNFLINISGTFYSDSELTPDTHYSYHIFSRNSAGISPPSATVSAATLLSIPEAPTGLTAVPISSTQIDLNWNASNSAESYDVYRDNNYLVNVTSTNYDDTGLASNTNYSYHVTARNIAGVSDPSNTASATTQASQTFPPIPGCLPELCLIMMRDKFTPCQTMARTFICRTIT